VKSHLSKRSVQHESLASQINLSQTKPAAKNVEENKMFIIINAPEKLLKFLKFHETRKVYKLMSEFNN
jgi:hypothetical protein